MRQSVQRERDRDRERHQVDCLSLPKALPPSFTCGPALLVESCAIVLEAPVRSKQKQQAQAQASSFGSSCRGGRRVRVEGGKNSSTLPRNFQQTDTHTHIMPPKGTQVPLAPKRQPPSQCSSRCAAATSGWGRPTSGGERSLAKKWLARDSDRLGVGELSAATRAQSKLGLRVICGWLLLSAIVLAQVELLGAQQRVDGGALPKVLAGQTQEAAGSQQQESKQSQQSKRQEGANSPAAPLPAATSGPRNETSATNGPPSESPKESADLAASASSLSFGAATQTAPNRREQQVSVCGHDQISARLFPRFRLPTLLHFRPLSALPSLPRVAATLSLGPSVSRQSRLPPASCGPPTKRRRGHSVSCRHTEGHLASWAKETGCLFSSLGLARLGSFARNWKISSVCGRRASERAS